MTRTRTLLGGLVVVGLALSACGGDDDAASDDTTTTQADDDPTTTTSTTAGDAIDVCGLVDLEVVNAATGETFTETEQTEADTCQVTNAEGTALLQLSVYELEPDQTAYAFVEDAHSACDEGTALSDLDLDYAEAGFACEISGEVALGVVRDGAAALLVGHPSDPSITTEQIVGALDQIAESILTR